MQTIHRSVAVLLPCLLAWLPATGQQRFPTQRLRIIVLEGNNVVNYIPMQMATAPVVEVRDENDRPVEGAAVTFKVPSSGPGAAFEGGQTTQSTITDFRGQAGARGYTINSQPGRFVIEVAATYQDQTSRLLIVQTNSTEALPAEITGERRSGKVKWLLIGIAAGVGTGLGIYFATRGSGPISVSTGPVIVAGPR